MDPLQHLVELEALKRLKARYFRCLDTKDWEGWLGVFTDDATLAFDLAVSTGGAEGVTTKLEGKKAIAEFVPRDLSKAQTVHQGHTPEIDIISSTEARGIWAMEDIVDHGDSIIHGFGHYRETYRKVADEWRIASVHLTRVRLAKTGRDRISL